MAPAAGGARAMPQFTVNPHLHDPYKNFKFRVKWDGRYVAGIFHVSPLRRATEVVQHREGGDPSIARNSPGRTEYDAITLSRGVTHDAEFEAWANLVGRHGGQPEMSLAHFRKDVVLELLNEAGQLVRAYKIYRCWPSEYVALDTLDANGQGGNGNAVAIETLVLQNEGWERDAEVGEPVEA
jgi:phage tail-like protein